MDEHLIDPPQDGPDDRKCANCRKLESKHDEVRSGKWLTSRGWEEVVLLFCPDDGEVQFEPYSDSDYQYEEEQARDDAQLQKAGQ